MASGKFVSVEEEVGRAQVAGRQPAYSFAHSHSMASYITTIIQTTTTPCVVKEKKAQTRENSLHTSVTWKACSVWEEVMAGAIVVI